MKMVYISGNIANLDDLLNLLKQCNIVSFQIFDNVKAFSPQSEPRLDNAIWPGYNFSALMQVEEEKYQKIKENVKVFNKNAYNASEFFTFASWNLEELFFD